MQEDYTVVFLEELMQNIMIAILEVLHQQKLEMRLDVEDGIQRLSQFGLMGVTFTSYVTVEDCFRSTASLMETRMLVVESQSVALDFKM